MAFDWKSLCTDHLKHVHPLLHVQGDKDNKIQENSHLSTESTAALVVLLVVVLPHTVPCFFFPFIWYPS